MRARNRPVNKHRAQYITILLLLPSYECTQQFFASGRTPTGNVGRRRRFRSVIVGRCNFRCYEYIFFFVSIFQRARNVPSVLARPWFYFVPGGLRSIIIYYTRNTFRRRNSRTVWPPVGTAVLVTWPWPRLRSVIPTRVEGSADRRGIVSEKRLDPSWSITATAIAVEGPWYACINHGSGSIYPIKACSRM